MFFLVDSFPPSSTQLIISGKYHNKQHGISVINRPANNNNEYNNNGDKQIISRTWKDHFLSGDHTADQNRQRVTRTEPEDRNPKPECGAVSDTINILGNNIKIIIIHKNDLMGINTILA
jgi:hypothetical protein